MQQQDFEYIFENDKFTTTPALRDFPEKDHQYFRVRYFAKKHNDFIERIGLVDDKMRLWEDSNEEICFTYFDLKQNGYRTAKNIDYIQTASLRKEALN